MTTIETSTTPDGVGVVSLAGRLTMATAAELEEAVTSLVEAGSVRVVVDLAETSFVDSSGLGALVASLKRCRRAGGDLRLASATEQVISVLAVTNLDRVLAPRPSVEEAYR